MSKRIIAGALAGAVLASTMAPMGVYADSPEVNIWVSKVNATDSGMEKGLEKQTPVHFGSGDSASTNNLIVVDENNTYQTVDGFGASITEASAHLYQTNLDDSAKAAAMQALFDKESGIGLSMLRQTIGASRRTILRPTSKMTVCPTGTFPMNSSKSCRPYRTRWQLRRVESRLWRLAGVLRAG